MNAKVKKILIFDDDEDIVSICTFILEEDGWEVLAYEDCNYLSERIISFAPNVILMDNWIPEEGGITATRQIKANSSLAHIPVIYFSANSNIETLAANAGADLILSKPFDLDQLRQITTQAIDAR
ncbi:response regulator [Mucilaginibacter sp. JRF]|uniref:response regulator n=1 Tax=Mucilaginibacter sp. JRF TaxID=2780088 RepID=UPI00187F072D|nr:response regulator [Mucilaginibacter sp. JRF]MBE9586680.1 response regulator [Mucilaginibacter sp. JRF]